MFKYLKLLRKYNALELKYETLQELVKEDCFNKIINKLGEPETIKRLREENKRLRIKLKDFKNKKV